MKQEKDFLSNEDLLISDEENEKEIRELLEFGFDAQDAINNSLANDGRIDAKDFPYLFPLLSSAGPAFENVGNPLARWKELSQAAKDRVKAWAKERFDLIDDYLEFLIEDTLVFVGTTIEGSIRLTNRWRKYLNPELA